MGILMTVSMCRKHNHFLGGYCTQCLSTCDKLGSKRNTQVLKYLGRVCLILLDLHAKERNHEKM